MRLLGDALGARLGKVPGPLAAGEERGALVGLFVYLSAVGICVFVSVRGTVSYEIPGLCVLLLREEPGAGARRFLCDDEVDVFRDFFGHGGARIVELPEAEASIARLKVVFVRIVGVECVGVDRVFTGVLAGMLYSYFL